MDCHLVTMAPRCSSARFTNITWTTPLGTTRVKLAFGLGDAQIAARTLNVLVVTDGRSHPMHYSLLFSPGCVWRVGMLGAESSCGQMRLRLHAWNQGQRAVKIKGLSMITGHVI